MTPAPANPILAVDTVGHATPLRVAAERAGWPVMDHPTPRELLRAVFLRSHGVVVIGLGPNGQGSADGDAARRLLMALHASSTSARVLAAGFGTRDDDEQLARQRGAAAYLHDGSAAQLIEAAHALLPAIRRLAPSAPVHDKHPARADPNLAPRAHLAKLLPHPPPSRAGPRRRAM